VPEELIRRNRDWASRVQRDNPDFFPRLAALQKPDYFWIGCADARVPANVVAGLEPGEVFVHRNVANVVHASDLNLLSALQFAIEGLGIRKIIICGHYGCGGVKAACSDHHGHGLVDHWIAPIRALRHSHKGELNSLTPTDQENLLVELNVRAGVERVAETPILQDAWAAGLPVAVHGMVYSLENGILSQLEDATRVC
jgi:carbonic anhydrase